MVSEQDWKLFRKKTGVNAIMSRSKMIENIYALLDEGAITKDDLLDFSEELRNEIIRN